MNKYLEIMLCIWVTMAVLRLSIDFWTTKWRFKKNTELLNTFKEVSDDIKELKDYTIYANEVGRDV